MSVVRGPKDVGAGLIYLALGIAALWFGADYKMGTAGEMGPGYFPKVLAAILVVIGTLATARGLIVRGSPVDTVGWKPLILVLGSVVLFGALVTKAGFVVALLTLGLVSAAASRHFRLTWPAVAGLAALVALCTLVFVIGLGIPMPIVGPWLEPALAWLSGR